MKPSTEYLLEQLAKCDRAISLETVKGSCIWGRIQRDRILELLQRRGEPK
jgi:hypothetical protein